MSKFVPTPKEVISAMQEIFELCITNNDPENDRFGTIFFVRHEAHVRWFEVQVAHKHYAVTIYNARAYYHPENVEDLEEWTLDKVRELNSIHRDLVQLSKGKFSVKIQAKIGE